MIILTSLVLALLIVLAPAAASAGQADERVVIKFQSGKGPQGKAAIAAAGGQIARDLGPQNAVGAWISAAARQGLSRNPNIEYIEDDPKRFPLGQTTPWGISAVQADITNGGSPGTHPLICVIDSGYSWGHEDLPGSVAGTNTNLAWDEDGCGHGTHVAGTISALDNTVGVVGVVPSANLNLHIVRVFGSQCTWAYSSDLVDALNLCQSAGADVVSMSLGCSGGPGGGPFACRNKTEEAAFDAAYAAGVLSFAAAGNDGNTAHTYPASYDSVVSVAAVDSANNVADFSQQTDQVELAAPGVAVRSTVPMGTGSEESLVSGGASFEVIAIEGSPPTSGTGALVDCGLGESICNASGGQVCLIERGNITFADKVLNCQAGGGSAAVIFNNVSGLFSGTLGGVDTFIPSVSLSQADGVGLSGSGANSTVTVGPGNFAYFDGTSMATPHAAGVAALVWSNDSSWTNQEIRAALAATAMDLGAAGRDNAYGHGMVQAKAALDYLAGGSPPAVNQPPQASFTYSCIALDCAFDATDSSDDSGIASYAWTFGDGGEGNGLTPAHLYVDPDTYTVTLTVTDTDGESDEQSQQVTVSSGGGGGDGVTLSARGYKVKGRKRVDLTWSGASSAEVDVYRDADMVVTTANDGAYTDAIGTRGGGSHAYKMCEASTITCSDTVVVIF